MAKSGRRRFGILRRRLLSGAIAVVALALARAEGPESLGATLFVSSFEVEVGDVVVVEVIVRDAEPRKVSVTVTETPPSFSLVGGRRERRQLTEGDAAGQAAVVRFEYATSEAGEFSLGSFEVSIDGSRVILPAVRVVVTRAPGAVLAELRWRLEEQSPAVALASVITLEVRGVASSATVRCDAPENAMLEPLAVESGTIDADGWFELARYRWTPLFPGSHALPVATVSDPDHGSFSSPRTTVSVRDRAAAREKADRPGAASGDDPALRDAFSAPKGPRAPNSSVGDSGALPEFPVAAESVPKRLSSIVVEARRAWESGDAATAIASLRRAERADLFPARVRALRELAEVSLGFAPGEAQGLAAWKPFALPIAAILAALAFVARLVSLSLPRMRFVSFGIALAFLAVLAFSARVYLGDRYPIAVSRGASLSHVPAPRSSVVSIAGEGRSLRVRRSAGDWLFVETEGKAGWVRRDDVIVVGDPVAEEGR